MKVITLLIGLMALLLFRPFQLQSMGMLYPDDDYDYLAHATAIAYGQFPKYDREFFYGKGRPLGAIGTGLMAAPFVWLGSWVDRVNGSDIVQQRNLENITHSWSQFGFVLGTVFYFWLGCFLLWRGASYIVAPRWATWAVGLMVLTQGLPLFVFYRPVFSHVYEFALQSMLIFYLMRSRTMQNPADLLSGKHLFLVGLISGLVFLVRLNNVVMALLAPALILGPQVIKQNWRKRIASLGFVYGLFAMLIATFKLWPQSIINGSGYGSAATTLLDIQSFSFYVRRIIHILFGLDWGLLYTAPFLLMGLLSLCFWPRLPYRKSLLIMAFVACINLYVVMMWRTQGGWYGYRYFVASMIPIVTLPLAFSFQKLSAQSWGRSALWLCLSFAIFPFASMVLFEGNHSTLNLAKVMQYFGVQGIGNNLYQTYVWETLLKQPQLFLTILLDKGLVYLYYQLSVFSRLFFSNEVFYDPRYTNYSGVVLLKTLCIYVLPWISYYVFVRKDKHQRNDQYFCGV